MGDGDKYPRPRRGMEPSCLGFIRGAAPYFIRFNTSNPTQMQRIAKYKKMTQELTETMQYYERYPEIRRVVKYIDNNLEQWFTCVKFPDIEPTNNLAEQAIRECVMVRKIIGAFRSIEGAHYYERLASLFATWQMRKLDVQTELRRILTSNLCFS